MTLGRLVVREGNRTQSFDFEERALSHAKEMLHLKTRCAQGNRTWSVDLEERALAHASEM